MTEERQRNPVGSTPPKLGTYVQVCNTSCSLTLAARRETAPTAVSRQTSNPIGFGNYIDRDSPRKGAWFGSPGP